MGPIRKTVRVPCDSERRRDRFGNEGAIIIELHLHDDRVVGGDPLDRDDVGDRASAGGRDQSDGQRQVGVNRDGLRRTAIGSVPVIPDGQGDDVIAVGDVLVGRVLRRGGPVIAKIPNPFDDVAVAVRARVRETDRVAVDLVREAGRRQAVAAVAHPRAKLVRTHVGNGRGTQPGIGGGGIVVETRVAVDIGGGLSRKHAVVAGVDAGRSIAETEIVIGGSGNPVGAVGVDEQRVGHDRSRVVAGVGRVLPGLCGEEPFDATVTNRRRAAELLVEKGSLGLGGNVGPQDGVGDGGPGACPDAADATCGVGVQGGPDNRHDTVGRAVDRPGVAAVLVEVDALPERLVVDEQTVDDCGVAADPEGAADVGPVGAEGGVGDAAARPKDEHGPAAGGEVAVLKTPLRLVTLKQAFVDIDRGVERTPNGAGVAGPAAGCRDVAYEATAPDRQGHGVPGVVVVVGVIDGPAAAVRDIVVNERAVDQSGGAVGVVYPRAEVSEVPPDGRVGDREIAVAHEKSRAGAVDPGRLPRPSAGDAESVNDDGRGSVENRHDVVGVVEHVGPASIGARPAAVVAVQVAAQDRLVRDGISRGAIGFSPYEPAVQGPPAGELKRGVPVATGSCRSIGPGSHPDLATRISQCVLEIGVRVFPRGAIVEAGRAGIHVNHRLHAACGAIENGHRQHRSYAHGHPFDPLVTGLGSDPARVR